MLRTLRKYWKRMRQTSLPSAEFDPLFYTAHHPDLEHLTTPDRLWAHFVSHGRQEGRPQNLEEAMILWQNQYGPLPENFSVATYRLLNEDLAASLVHDHQFIRHFLEHGRREGRPFGLDEFLPPYPETRLLVGGSWPALFRTAEFVAMSQDWLPERDLSRAQALQIFAEQGVARLSPISFRHIFDPGFYRETYRLSSICDDVTLYREWLEVGVSARRAPNEKIFLQPYLGAQDYPARFNWQAYRDRLPARARADLANRAQTLAYLFDSDPDPMINPLISQDFDLLRAIGDMHFHRGSFRQATKAYDLARKVAGNRADAMFHYRAGCSRRVFAAAEGLSDFRLAIKQGHAPWEAVETAVDILVGQGAFDEALAILHREKAVWSQRPEFLRCVRRTLDGCLESAKTQALDLYGVGERAEADDIVTKTLQTIRDTIEHLEPLPPAMHHHDDGPVVILANQDLPQCKHYRVEQKLRQFKMAGLQAQAFPHEQTEAFITALAGARAAIFYRVEATPGVLRAMLYARAFGLPTYFEIDDLLFDSRYFPDCFESYEGQISKIDFHRLELGVPLLRFAMAMCDTAIASTPVLARHMAPAVRSGRALLLRNGLDERNDEVSPAASTGTLFSEAITLFYGTGTKAHSSDFTRDLAPALLALLGKHPNLRLVIAGYLQLGPEFAPYALRITHTDFIPDLAQYWALLQTCDINLAVLSQSPMTDCKSEIKWLEAAVLGVPSIVSSTATYREVLTHGIDALLVEKPDDWLPMIEQLIVDRASRSSIARNAREKALGSYGLMCGANILATEFAGQTETHLEKAEVPRLKVLICNVFFAPQSFGGATRIVQDNVNHLIDHCPDIEVSIFTSDQGRLPIGNLRCETYRGCPLFRISPPQEELSDWRPFNSAHEASFRKVLDLVKPDMVHFHCIQRLTASIVEITAQVGIPYLITLHDGWWISDSQFFTDDDGRLWAPSEDLMKICPVKGVSVPQSVARRRALCQLLTGAKHILSVSKSFADVYRHAGIPGVSVLENGVPLLQSPTRYPRPDGRLSLGHLGGRSLHKGAVLIEAALRRGSYDHLALTMIDNTMRPEESVTTYWGRSPVLLRGPCAQHRMSELYGELDVLLAPSIWPESFGLVTREALALGLKVVASDRGAIGDNIEPANGAIVDVSSIEALEQILKEMNAEPDKWRVGTAPATSPLRTSEDQARELALIYRSVGSRIL